MLKCTLQALGGVARAPTRQPSVLVALAMWQNAVNLSDIHQTGSEMLGVLVLVPGSGPWSRSLVPGPGPGPGPWSWSGEGEGLPKVLRPLILEWWVTWIGRLSHRNGKRAWVLGKTRKWRRRKHVCPRKLPLVRHSLIQVHPSLFGQKKVQSFLGITVLGIAARGRGGAPGSL